MATTGTNWMEQLGANNLFNNGIVVSILSFLGVNLAEANEIIVFVVGVLTAIVLTVRVGLYIGQFIKWLKKRKKDK